MDAVSWEPFSPLIQVNPENPAQKFTPPLPDMNTSKISDTVEQIALVPYSSTHLRVTIFSNLGRSKSLGRNG